MAKISPLPMFGSEASLVRTSLLHEWESVTGSEASSQASFSSLLALLERTAPEFLFSKTLRVYSVRTKEETSALFSGRWPSSGILSDGVCLTASISESPSRASESSLLGVIETRKAPRKYFLSANAARGMLRRADRMGRPLFRPLRESLNILAEKER